MSAPEVPWWASDDPWAMSPEERAAHDERRRQREAASATTPDEPPELKVTPYE